MTKYTNTVLNAETEYCTRERSGRDRLNPWIQAANDTRKKKTYERVDGLRSLVYLGLARNIHHAMDHYHLYKFSTKDHLDTFSSCFRSTTFFLFSAQSCQRISFEEKWQSLLYSYLYLYLSLYLYLYLYF